MSAHRWLTPAEVNERTGIPVGTLRNWRYLHKGPPFRSTGKRGSVRYPEDELEAWLSAPLVRPAS